MRHISSEATPPRALWREGLKYGLVAASVWLAWEIVKTPVVERAPGRIALRVAPASPEANRRAAEAALVTNDVAGAKALSERSLAAAPFNARALRVRGLVEAREGSIDRADQLLTLAGNWSLRDDPTHAWLVEHRLRRGDYASAFAHADTLARRRNDLHPQLFNFYTTAAISDPRALPALLQVLSRNPPWRLPYIDYLKDRPGAEADALLLALGLNLNRSPHPLTRYESGQIYRSWLSEGRFGALRALAISRDARLATNIANGDFAQELDPDLVPIGWNLKTGAGMTAQIVPREEPGHFGLNAHYSGYGSVEIAEQLLLLEPGQYVLSSDQVIDSPTDTMRLAWTIRCADTGSLLTDSSLPSGEVGEEATLRAEFDVPHGCAAQWLRLESRSNDRRYTATVTITRVALSRRSS